MWPKYREKIRTFLPNKFSDWWTTHPGAGLLTVKSMDYILNKESEGIIITLYGLITGDEIRSLNHKLITSKNFPKWLYQIWDFSKAEQSDLSLGDLRSIVFQDTIAADNHPNVKVAIIPRQRKKKRPGSCFPHIG